VDKGNLVWFEPGYEKGRKIMDIRELFDHYQEVRAEERGLRREVQDAAMREPLRALEAGLISFTMTFPCPGSGYREELLGRLHDQLARR